MKKRFAILGLLLLAVLVGFALSQNLQVTQYSISGEKLMQDAVLAVVSDLHNSVFGESQAQLAEQIHAANPDAVLLTGDMAQDLATLRGTQLLVEALGGRYPMFYVSGNHESASGELVQIKARLRELGVRVLEGDGEMLPCGVRIAGVDDPRDMDEDAWQAQLDGCRSGEDAFTVLLSHRPERAGDYAGFDLVVCGHAHGGQARLPGILPDGLWAPNQGFFPGYTRGVHELENGSMIVSRGLSKGLLPRVFNRPELVIVHLQAQ